MSTKLVNEIYIEKNKLENLIDSDINQKIDELIAELYPLPKDELLKVDKKDVFLDTKLMSILPYLNKHSAGPWFDNGTPIEEINKYLNDKYPKGFKWELMNRIEQNWRNCKIMYGYQDCNFSDLSSYNYSFMYLLGGKTQSFSCCNYNFSSSSSGCPLPICRLNGENSKPLSQLSEYNYFMILFSNNIVLEYLSSEVKEKFYSFFEYAKQFNITYDENSDDLFWNYNIEDITISNDEIENLLLEEDYQRASILKYSNKRLEDINEGHWSLWDQKEKDGFMKYTLEGPLVARDPESSIVDGIVGIDFGTKSTIVAYQKDKVHTLPMRIGTGDLDQKIEKHHYENPTILEFVNLEKFSEDYSRVESRPFTDYDDLTVSHNALNSLSNVSSEFFDSFLYNLKQWAGATKESSKRFMKLKIKDQYGYIKDINEYKKLEENDFDPIEVYAYYLGLYINNMHNGIYMKYYISFPVGYEVEVREKLVSSFERGIRKSLPLALVENTKAMEKFSVQIGTSEPAAYAVTALQEYGFQPDDEEYFYGIFDFGGGTTDFDFGIWRGPKDRKEDRYDYVIEHFGEGGDRYLGGENILELLAFEVFKSNEDVMRSNSFTFVLPAECNEFPGSELLLANSRESNFNTKRMMEYLRGFWENNDRKNESIMLFNKNGEEVNVTLTIDYERLYSVLRYRIKRGVENFFASLTSAFEEKSLNHIDKIHIFFAGNSSKSPLVRELFNEVIDEKINSSAHVMKDTQLSKDFFQIFPALGTEESYQLMEERNIPFNRDSLESPTGKTGVAFGIIASRKGGSILVKNMNVSSLNSKDEIPFKYYLGRNRKNKFKLQLDKSSGYNNWIQFIDASENDFEVYYTTEPSATTNNLDIKSDSIKLKRLSIPEASEDGYIYIRAVSPTEFEYVVALEDEINENIFKGDITKVQLG